MGEYLIGGDVEQFGNRGYVEVHPAIVDHFYLSVGVPVG